MFKFAGSECPPPRKAHVARVSAFTLAEVLITLGIIGVVSAVTLPTLVKNHQRTVYVTQLRKVVNSLSQAAEQAITDNNAISLAETKYRVSNSNAASDFLKTYFKVIQECTSTWTPCMASEYNTLNGGVFSGWSFTPSAKTPCVLLADGASVCMYEGFLGDAYVDNIKWHGYTEIYIDVNGKEGPNILGRDLFYTLMYSDGKVAESYDRINNKFDDCETGKGYGYGCLSQIMNDGWKMDY